MESPNTFIEQSYWQKNLLPAGIDEAGRGPLAGPVVAAAVIIPDSFDIPGIKDSKKLNPKKRKSLYDQITRKALSYGIGMIGPEEIDRINILQAAIKAMKLAVENLSIKPDVLLVDGINKINLSIHQKTFVKGDNKCISIAAASVLAKVTRDSIMDSYDREYPLYRFIKHKGYPTREHFEILRQYGPTDIHRKTFKGVL